MRLDDVLGARRDQFAAGRERLGQLQAVFDEAFGKEVCVLRQTTRGLTVYVTAAGQAQVIQLQKHTITKQLQGIDPDIRSVRIVIGKPRD